MRLDRRALMAGLSATLLAPRRARAATVTDAAEGAIGAVLSRVQLEALYGAPVEIVTDTAAGKSAFLPG
jgi:hypothetical protein